MSDRAAAAPHRVFAAVVAPFQAFFRLEAASGVLLLGCAVVALAWSNAAPESYRAAFATRLSLAAGPLSASFTLHQLVNEGLMTLFFAVVGMEIKRELVQGELRTVRQAVLPLVAALGGMIVPAGIFLALNAGRPGAAGWGIPMATDIAFCIGVLALLGRRVPRALVVFVTALAIFDDIGGILVIALFYGGGIDAGWVLAAAGASAAAFALGRARVASALAWTIVGATIWWTLHHAGVHATLAGVVVGLAVPARPRRPLGEVFGELAAHAGLLARAAADEARDDAAAHAIEERLEELESPLGRFVHVLHPWMAFAVMPLFALANSGVELRSLEPSQLAGGVAVGTAAGLFAGKLSGIFLLTLVAVRAGLAPLPGGTSPAKLLGASAVAGIGFTVALFIAALAFPGAPDLLDEAKVGILAGSLASGIVGALVLRATSPAEAAEAVGAAAPAEAARG